MKDSARSNLNLEEGSNDVANKSYLQSLIKRYASPNKKQNLVREASPHNPNREGKGKNLNTN